MAFLKILSMTRHSLRRVSPGSPSTRTSSVFRGRVHILTKKSFGTRLFRMIRGCVFPRTRTHVRASLISAWCCYGDDRVVRQLPSRKRSFGTLSRIREVFSRRRRLSSHRWASTHRWLCSEIFARSSNPTLFFPPRWWDPILMVELPGLRCGLVIILALPFVHLDIRVLLRGGLQLTFLSSMRLLSSKRKFLRVFFSLNSRRQMAHWFCFPPPLEKTMFSIDVSQTAPIGS